METIILNAVIVSCVVSALFVMIRVYFTYFAKRNCSNYCKCDTSKDGRIVSCRDFVYREVCKNEEQKDLANAVELAATEAAIKPKRVRKAKAEAPTTEPVKKKPGRKKKAE